MNNNTLQPTIISNISKTFIYTSPSTIISTIPKTSIINYTFINNYSDIINIKSTIKSIPVSNSKSSVQKTPIFSSPSTLYPKILSSFPFSSHSSSINVIKTLSSFIQKKEIKNENTIINNQLCSFEYSYKIITTNECKKSCSYNDFINEICYINNLNDNNIMNITQDFRNLISKLEVNENTNLIIHGNNVVYQIISSEVMDENINKNISIIDFGDCERKIKSIYSTNYILILKLDKILSNSTNIIMKYEVYNPYTLEKIDLSICNDMTINAYLPYLIPDEDLALYIKLQESGYDLYNPNDSFYHDLCTPFTTYNYTDILLSDRRLDYYKNISFCEEGCTYKSYDYKNKRVQCECQIKNEIDNNIDNINFYGSIFLSNFLGIENLSNIKVLKCFKLVFSKIAQNKNNGSYIFIILILIYIILMVLFYKNGKNQLFNIVNTVIKNDNIKMPIR